MFLLHTISIDCLSLLFIIMLLGISYCPLLIYVTILIFLGIETNFSTNIKIIKYFYMKVEIQVKLKILPGSKNFIKKKEALCLVKKSSKWSNL